MAFWSKLDSTVMSPPALICTKSQFDNWSASWQIDLDFIWYFHKTDKQAYVDESCCTKRETLPHCSVLRVVSPANCEAEYSPYVARWYVHLNWQQYDDKLSSVFMPYQPPCCTVIIMIIIHNHFCTVPSCTAARWFVNYKMSITLPLRDISIRHLTLLWNITVFKFTQNPFKFTKLQQHSEIDTDITGSVIIITRGQSNLTKSASWGAHSPVRGHPRGSKFVPLNSWGRGSY